MARGKLPASERFFDSGCRFRRLKKEPKGIHFSISVRMPSDGDHDGWWWSAPLPVHLACEQLAIDIDAPSISLSPAAACDGFELLVGKLDALGLGESG